MKPDYFERYPTIAFERDEHGILVMRLHSDGGPVAYRAQHHADWCNAFYDVGRDRDNRVVILTGTGDAFINQMAWDKSIENPGDWEDIHSEGKRLLRNLLDIEVPVIGAVNGPATIHAELAVLSDITLASTTATFQDFPHMNLHTVPGDGVHVVWTELLGSNRGRYFLLTGQTLSAQQALDLGVVNEVLPPDQVLARARELARQLVEKPPLTVRYARTAMTVRWKRLLDEALGYGLALEGLASIDLLLKMKKS
ncbi:Enoyl-CoA hydratase/isomerase [Burkholderia sp. H160]|nr:Enoyl-CoA hydratase/isomerase [Burkholderia sp. H160]